MKVSKLWLHEWVDISSSTEILTERLTMAGLTVDALVPVSSPFTGVVVAQVKTAKPHPGADKLTLCEVDAGGACLLKIVCGAKNVRSGLKVALATVGAKLPGDFLIKEAKLRGELSQGMLCSSSELGLSDDFDGIMELDDDAPIGSDLRCYLSLDDEVFDVDVTPNRADCLSVLGIAREVAALTKLTLKSAVAEKVLPSLTDTLSIQIDASLACKNYSGRIIRQINPDAKTPVWMRERLRRAGLRVVSPVVDITNYVMLELGQPMHAFDLTKIEGGIVVRFAKSNETIRLLGDQEVSLTPRMMLIADSKKPLAIAGVMGGHSCAVVEDTRSIFLESAWFNPVNIAGVARSLGLCSDSAPRFERGVDPNLQLIALERATALLVEITGAAAGPISQVSSQDLSLQNEVILFNPKQVLSLIGISIKKHAMQSLLESVGFIVDSSIEIWRVCVPTYRFDVNLEVDLIEEIVRLYGYDKISGEKLTIYAESGIPNQNELTCARISQYLIARGYHETINYSFVDPTLQKELYPDLQCFELLNPISSELSVMRVGMWPGLIASMIYNVHRQQTAFKLFESGVVFSLINENVIERSCVAGLLYGEYGVMNWSEQSGFYDFYDLKGCLEGLFAGLQLQLPQFVAHSHTALHPGKSARILLDDKEIGFCGVLHPRIASIFELQNEVLLFELDVSHLSKQEPHHYQHISRYPQVRRDLSLLVDKVVTAAEIEEVVRQTVPENWLKAFDVFDVYTEGAIPKGKKSVAVAIILQDNKRTLLDTEINLLIAAIIKILQERFSITLRL